MSDNPTVRPLGQAVLGVPDACPLCGGRLGFVFGQIVGDDGARRPVIDYSAAACRDCYELFKVAEKDEQKK